MKATIRKMGNSQGVIIPKPLLEQLGFADVAEMTVENDALVLRTPRRAVRAGWAQAAAAIADEDNDTLVWPEFTNEGDGDLTW